MLISTLQVLPLHPFVPSGWCLLPVKGAFVSLLWRGFLSWVWVQRGGIPHSLLGDFHGNFGVPVLMAGTSLTSPTPSAPSPSPQSCSPAIPTQSWENSLHSVKHSVKHSVRLGRATGGKSPAWLVQSATFDHSYQKSSFCTSTVWFLFIALVKCEAFRCVGGLARAAGEPWVSSSSSSSPATPGLLCAV